MLLLCTPINPPPLGHSIIVQRSNVHWRSPSPRQGTLLIGDSRHRPLLSFIDYIRHSSLNKLDLDTCLGPEAEHGTDLSST